MERLLERDDELRMLDGVLDDAAAAGRGRLVLLGGEAGIGKTTLTTALLEHAQAAGLATLAAGCEALSVPVPLAPVLELAVGAGLAHAGAADGPSVLARALLEHLARHAPTLMVIEDAHWADAATLDVLRLLSRRLDATGAVAIVTYRDDELAANPDLARLVGDLAPRDSIVRVTLRPLSPAAVRELAAPHGVDAARLVTLTGGNPFLVLETLNAGGAVPATVRDATLARVGRLGPAARSAVEAAAVCGQRIDPALLDELEPNSAPAVEEALALGVLMGGDDGTLAFRHELTRVAIEGAISPFRRTELHGRVLDALQRRGSDDSARLAHHAELAGRPSVACRHAIAAAGLARSAGSLREASLQFERALRLDVDLAPAERFELLLAHSRTANFSNVRLEVATASAREAAELADDEQREGRALVALAWTLWSEDRRGQAREAAERAVGLLEAGHDAVALAHAEAALIRMEATAFDPATALAAADRARELAAGAGEDVRLDVEISLGLARGHLGDEGALAHLAQACADAQAAGLPIQTVRSYVNQVFVGVALRRQELVDEVTATALASLEELQTPIPAAAIKLYHARSLLDRGDWEGAMETAMRTDLEWVSEQPLALTIRALVLARRGDARRATKLLEQAWEELREVPEASRHGVVRAAQIEAAWLRGDDAAAATLVAEAAAAPATARFALTGGEIALWAARLGVDGVPAPAGVATPVALELAGDAGGAVRAWNELGAPYDAALAALYGDDATAREALGLLRRLGADGACAAFARHRARTGARVPRGPRRATLDHPAGLTAREQEVLEHLASGATNAAIAAALHLSVRTVGHHVSAILAKLDAPNRGAAAAAARALGLLDASEDGQDAEPD